jgi:hypothetical protein
MQISILGKVNTETKKDLGLDVNKNYYFVGYTFYEFPVKSKFLLNNNIITLTEILLDGFIKSDYISSWFKSICEIISYKPIVIDEISSLSYYKTEFYAGCINYEK